MNININKDQAMETGKAILNGVHRERGTVAAVAAALLAGLCYWSQRKLLKIVVGK